MIGIEVTRLFKPADSRGRSRQAQEGEQKQMMSDARRVYGRLGLVPVDVIVHFTAETSFSKRNRNAFAQMLANLVASHIPGEKSSLMVHNNLSSPGSIPSELRSVTICRFRSAGDSWTVADAGWVLEDFVDELQSAISKKNELLTKYEPGCSSNWLLVVIEGRNPSTFFEPSAETLSHKYRSRFQRVFLLELAKSKIHELKIVGEA